MPLKTKIFVIVLLTFLTTQAQWNQIGSNINGESSNDYSGISVSTSSDGSIVAIGAYGNTANGPFTGHARVYQNLSNVWTQIGQDIDGDAEYDQMGISLSLSADGTILAVSAFGNDGGESDAGVTRIYNYQGGNWIQIGDDIYGESLGDFSGISVSLSADGTIVAIGADNNANAQGASGHVRVYENTGGTWTQVGQDLDGIASFDKFGYTVSLNQNGSVVAISAVNSDSGGADSGQVSVFENQGGNWVQLGNNIDGEAAGDKFGFSSSINNDGTIVAIGSHRNDGNGADSGQVRVFEYQGGDWVLYGSTILGAAEGDGFGISVSLTPDASKLAVGAFRNDENGLDTGQVRVFEFIGDDWIQYENAIEGDEVDERFGYSVSLSDDGSILASGAYFNDGNGQDSGAVRVFGDGFLSVTDNIFDQTYIYPNPATNTVYISSNIQLSNLKVYNVLGQLIMTKPLSSLETSVNISSLNKSIYIFKIETEKGAFSKTIIKE